MRKVDIPFVRWHVRALGHVTKVTQVTLLDDLVIILLMDPINLHGFALVHKVEQGRKGITQADTTSTAVAHIINTLKLLEEIFLIPVFIRLPIYRVSCRRF